MAGSRVLEPPRDLHPQSRIIGQQVELDQRLSLVERSLPEPMHFVGDAATGLGTTFLHSWVNNDNGLTVPTAGQRNAGFYKHEGRVYLSGVVRTGTVGQSVFTLPVGYRLQYSDAYYPVVSFGTIGFVIVDFTGQVVVGGGSNTYVFLEGIDFRVGN